MSGAGDRCGHPLFGELLAALAFRRFAGVLHLVVELPDGSPGTIRADATDVLAAGFAYLHADHLIWASGLIVIDPTSASYDASLAR